MTAKSRVVRLFRSRRVRVALGVVFVSFSAFLTFALADSWFEIGKRASGERLERMKQSPQWGERTFVNPEPMWNDVWGSVMSMFGASPHVNPDAPIDVDRSGAGRFATPPASGLRVTWLGHSTLLIELDGATFLTDPIFGGRAAPVSWAGPATWYAPPIALEDLPPIDAVLISHDHYDHLQTETIIALAETGVRFVVPLGVDAHLAYWGVPDEQVSALDWWDAIPIAGTTLTATPSRHASGRQILDQNRTLWAGYAIAGPDHRAYFSGDTGLFPAMDDIGERLGPFDVTMIEVGAYNAAWPDWHLGPEQALRAHRMVRGDVFMPVHWGMMNLSTHGWTEPAERVRIEAERRGTRYVIPRPGGSFEPDALPEPVQWWPSLPFDTAEDAPIRATAVPPEAPL